MAGLHLELARISALFAIESAIALADFTRAERLIAEYVDTEVALLAIHS